MNYLARFFLSLFGWRYMGRGIKVKKAVMLCAPHTSMWDFIIGKLFFWSINISPKIFIKSDYFYFPLGIVLRMFGAIPVSKDNRGRRLVPYITQRFRQKNKFYLAITPEGTRQKRVKWKRGFYEIAKNAGVPIYLCKLDYAKKTATEGELFYPTGDYQRDLAEIQSHYNDVTAKYPTRFAKEY